MGFKKLMFQNEPFRISDAGQIIRILDLYMWPVHKDLLEAESNNNYI